MNTQRGISLVELVVFIVIVGIMSSGLLVVFNNVLNFSYQPGQQLRAAHLASARINAITLQRLAFGFDNIIDPCEPSPSSIDACSELSQFANSVDLSVASTVPSISPATVSAIVKIEVTGDGNATEVERFVR